MLIQVFVIAVFRKVMVDVQKVLPVALMQGLAAAAVVVAAAELLTSIVMATAVMAQTGSRAAL